MKALLTIAVNISRLVLALTFILSGYVKAVDPLGTQYKIQDYLTALGIDSLVPDMVTLGTSVVMSAVEFVMGVMMLFAISRKLVSRLVLAFMLIMTAVTVWLYTANPISDCGCFGDAIHLSNGETLLKNILLLTMAAIVAYKPRATVRLLSDSHSFLVFDYAVFFAIATSVYSLYYLPPFDFRPYHIGTD